MSHPNTQIQETDVKEKEIKIAEFCIMSPEEIRRRSVANIEHVELYENKEPKVGGLADIRMGCIDSSMECYTCGETINNCPGHFGHIELNTPVYHIGFIKIVKKILECVCYTCARFRLLPTEAKYKKLRHVKDKFSFAWEAAKTKTVCEYPDCEELLLPVRRSGITLYFDPKKTDKKLAKRTLSAPDAREILTRISDETCRLIGLNPRNARPEWMIITVLPVPPPCVRPSVCMDFNGRGEDDLTHMLTNIIRYNNLVKKHENSRQIGDLKDSLQIHVISYMDNEVKSIPQQLQKGGRPIKSICARLKGKEGRIRGHLMGKRVDFSARTVITGDPNISIEEVGVPLAIAKNLTFPEIVSKWNIQKMQQLVDNSPNYPGAKFVIRKNGARIGLTARRGILPKLQYGDKVERHLITGDVVLFNRQPTLHKMSMMAHRVRVMNCSTFRLNVNVCSSYNADFDGDEMNLHVPQTYASIAELCTLSTVSTLLVSPQGNRPVNALVQDGLCGVTKLTSRNIFIEKPEMMNLVMWIKDDSAGINSFNGLPTPAILKPRPIWTGKQLVSMIIPEIDIEGYHSRHAVVTEDFEKTYPTPTPQIAAEFKHMYPSDTRVIIKDGQLLTGILCKKTVGPVAGGLIHVIWRDFGPEAARDFLDNIAQLSNQWTLNHGFSVGLGDMIIPKNLENGISAMIAEQHVKVHDVIDQFQKGLLISQGNLSLDDTKENQIQGFLAKARDVAGTTVSAALPVQNNIKQMVDSGSKGSILNICQISGSVGQQIVDGKRIPFGYANRTLPHFKENDDSPESRGFVKNSFIHGLSPHEVFFHGMGGREGLIDTAVKTAETGYIQRRLVKALEDLSVKPDGTVRNNRNDIIQFYYGEEGYDGTMIEKQKLETVSLSNTELFAKYFVEDVPEEFQLLKTDRDFLRDTLPFVEDSWALPLNIKRLIISAQRLPVLNKSFHTPRYIFDRIVNLRNNLRPSKGRWSPEHNPSHLFGILLSSTLATKTVLQRWKLYADQFDWLIRKIETQYYRGLVHPGEAVGVLVAQSIGEPATQMTLNSVDWTTELILKINGLETRTTIGAFVDSRMETAVEENIERHPGDTHLCHIRNDLVEISSCDENGRVSLKRVEAVTKHPVVNKDGSKTLLLVTTRSGRQVIATKAKSFLTRRDNKILPTEGQDLRIGDYLPVTLTDPTKAWHMEIPNVKLSTGLHTLTRDRINVLLMSNNLLEEDIAILENCLKEDIFYDRVETITEYLSSYPYVYDLTVEDTRNFAISSGLHMRDTFHSSGSGNKLVTSGIPRLNELINAVKNLQTPGMTVYLTEECRFDKTQVRAIKSRLEHTTLEKLVSHSEVIHDPDYTNTTITHDKYWLDQILQIPDEDLPQPLTFHPYVLRIVLCRKTFLEKGLFMDTIADQITGTFDGDIYTFYSDDNDADLVFHIRMFKDENADPDGAVDIPANEEFFHTNKFDLLSTITVSGIPGVEKAFVSQKVINEWDEDGAPCSDRKEYVIETDGINLKETLRIPGVDVNRLYCNDPQEMWVVFGVEVARETLMDEIRGVIESGGSYINHRHLSLLCDVMTNRGHIMSITRHGINKTEAGPLMKCTFEQTVDILMDAAVKGESDHLKGVAEHIMLGQLAPIGTGTIDVIEMPVDPRNQVMQTAVRENLWNPLKPKYLK